MQDKIYFKGLDGLRFIAFFMVYLCHGFMPIWANIKINQSNPWLQLLAKTGVNLGHEGVSVFFVLSGFLITYLLLTEIKLNGTINIKFFYMRRCLRIWPLFYLAVLSGLWLWPLLYKILNTPFGEGSIYLNILFLNNFDFINRLKEGGIAAFNPPLGITWSVAVEEQFYVFWPLLFLFLQSRYYLFTIVILILFSTLFKIANESNTEVYHFHTISALGDLAIGGLSAYLVTNNEIFKNFIENLNDKIRIFLYSFILGLAPFIGFIFSFQSGNTLGHLFAAFMYAFIILDQSFNSSKNLKISSYKNISLGGKYTYGLYLYHIPILLICMNIFDYFRMSYKNSWTDALLLGIVAFIPTVVVSYISYNYFERYFLIIKHKFTSNHT